MEPSLQDFIKLIFNVDIMRNAMKDLGYDSKKMPLGKLGEGTIKKAYECLTELLAAVKKNDNAAMTKLSGDFYTLIPHDFGFQKMSNFIINNEDKIKEKVGMLSTISGMKVTTKLLDQKMNEDDSVTDQNYRKLGCDIKALDKKSRNIR